MSISIKTRLVGSVAALGLTMAALGGVGWYGQSTTLSEAEMLATDHVAPMYRLKHISDMYAVNIVDATHKTGFGKFSWDEGKASIEQAESVLNKAWEEIVAKKKDFDPDEAEIMARIEKLKPAADAALAKFKAIIASRDPVALEAFRTKELYPDIDPFTAAVDDLVSLLVKNGVRDAKSAADLENLILLVSLGLGLLSALVLGGSIWTITKQVVGPINKMTDAMDRLAGGDNTVEVPSTDRNDEIGRMAKSVLTFKKNAIEKLEREAELNRQQQVIEEERQRAEAAKAREALEDNSAIGALASGLSALAAGDLTHRISITFTPKTEKLKDDFNLAMKQLEDAMGVIASNAGGIQTGAGEISQAADDLSRRTEQQAATLEETAAALDQITATVKKTALGANQANTVVVAARAAAERSGEVVKSAVGAMGQIEGSARQISQIIGVIDEIAFQTNLLALNAGVEAARAGDAGRGFAVVASEVRALAQRSADAAKEIKSLILASTNQVETGVKLVGDTGEALHRIVVQVSEISTLVSEIAASAQEQATALSQVNTAVNQMDQVTQQNAAMVEESTAASHSLAQESAELNKSVGRFKVANAPAAIVGSRHAAPHARPVQQMRATSQRKQLPAPTEANWEEF
jgi:methyl-accepting chemotaxis protein